MSRLFTFFEILSHNLAFVCAPPPTIHHRPYATLVLPTSARLSPRWGNTTLCAAIVCDNTPRSIARIAQTRYALHATAISLRSIRLRHALLPMRAIRAFVRVYRPAGAIRRSARLLSATIHRALCYGYFAALNTPTPCAIAHAGNTRICARLFRCAQYAVPAPLCAQSIVCTQSNPLRALFTVPPHPHSPHLWRMRRKPARTHDKF